MNKYILNSPHDLIVNPPTKSSWNRSVGTTINKYYINQMVKDAENKSSLKFLHLSEARYGHCHNIWSSCGSSQGETSHRNAYSTGTQSKIHKER